MSGSVLSEVRATIDDVPRWDDAPIVGRADELGRLLAHVDRAAGGRSSAVLLAGDAGVGKTRLLDELSVRAAERGVRVLTGHCVDLGDVGLPYLPFVDLLRPVAGEPELAPVSSANPVLAGLLAGRPGAELVEQPGLADPGVARQQDRRAAAADRTIHVRQQPPELLGPADDRGVVPAWHDVDRGTDLGQNRSGRHPGGRVSAAGDGCGTTLHGGSGSPGRRR